MATNLASHLETEEEKLVKIIESRTRGDIFVMLGQAGLGKFKKHKWKDYSEAKKICFQGLFIDSDIYDRQIGWICEFLKC